jgi:hypothetical protein
MSVLNFTRIVKLDRDFGMTFDAGYGINDDTLSHVAIPLNFTLQTASVWTNLAAARR